MEIPFGKETLGVYIPNAVRDALLEAARREDRSVSYIAGRILRQTMLDAIANDAPPPAAVNFATECDPEANADSEKGEGHVD